MSTSTMSKLEHALALASEGFYVFPLEPNSKVPAIDGWQHKASRDPKQIRRWWTDPVMDTEMDRNIGIFTGKFNDHDALIVIDVDCKDGKKGFESLADYKVPDTLTAETTTGGLHLIYVVGKPVKQGTEVLGPGLDIRSHGGYIVAPGSEIDGKFYRWLNS